MNKHTDEHTVKIRSHAKRRAKERYGLTLNKLRLRQISAACISRGSLHLRKERDGCTLRAFEFEGQPMLAIYDTGRKLVKTLLPKTDKRWKLFDYIPEATGGGQAGEAQGPVD